MKRKTTVSLKVEVTYSVCDGCGLEGSKQAKSLDSPWRYHEAAPITGYAPPPQDWTYAADGEFCPKCAEHIIDAVKKLKDRK